VDDLQALIAAAGERAAVYGLSSGAVLAVEAAARGAAITRLALFEPPVPVGDDRDSAPESGARLAALIAAGRRGDAVAQFLREIGLPAEAIAGLRQSPLWPGLEAMAHTIAYDNTITADGTLWTERAAAVTVPALVLYSGASSGFLLQAAQAAAAALPGARLRSLEGQYHDVPAETLAPVLTEFFLAGTDRSTAASRRPGGPGRHQGRPGADAGGPAGPVSAGPVSGGR
jgi:pimeloyl-ACP methyl ester carboxylesterase